MAVRGQADVQIKITTTSATGAFQDISNFCMVVNDVSLEAILEESDAFGDSWIEQLYTGIRRFNELTLGGIYDDAAASTPFAIFGQATDLGAERVLKINIGTTASGILKSDVLIRRFSRQPGRGALTRWEVNLVPTGAVTFTSAT